jgi:septum site-determining protein MinC
MACRANTAVWDLRIHRWFSAVNHPLTMFAHFVNQSESSGNRRDTVSSVVVRQRQSLMFRARSYMAFVLTPQPPIADWLADLDAGLERSQGFFAGHAVALDLSAVRLSPSAIGHLISNLEERGIRVLGIEGAESAGGDAKLPPILRGGRNTQGHEQPEQGAPGAASIAQKQQPAPASLLIEDPVRSGQTVVFIEGDITVLGSVGSGAEIVAGGSIHIYGTLRGRAMAGAAGNARARIFCHRVEAELLAIDTYYKTAEDIEDSLRCGPAQAWLEGRTLKISAMN